MLGDEHRFSSKFFKHISNLRGNFSGFDSSLFSVEVQKATSVTTEWQRSLFFRREGGRPENQGISRAKLLINSEICSVQSQRNQN